MPIDPNQDPRLGMSSGGPAPNQPTLPAPTSNPLFTPGSNPLNTGSPGNPTGPGVGGSNPNNPQLFDPNNPLGLAGSRPPANPNDPTMPMQPGDRTSPIFFGTDVNNAIGGILGTLFGNGSGGGGAGDAGPPATLGGAPQITATSGGAGAGAPGGGVGTLQGLDFTQPGALEQYQKNTAGYFNQPTLSEMFAKNAIAQGAGAAPTNRAEDAYQQFSSSQPANMDPYYANARRIAEENIRKTMAARGSYGSSAADDLYNEAYTNLAADQAQKEAQYGLSRGSLLGSLAQGADSSSLAGSADRRNWENALASIAGQGDVQGLNRITGGANIAGAAQGAQTTRGQNAFNNQLQLGDRMSNIMGQGYGNIFGTDLGLFNEGVGLNTGTATEGYNQAAQNALMQRNNVQNFNNLLGGNMQMGQSIYDMFNKPGGPQPSPMAGGGGGGGGYAGPPAADNYGTTNWYYPSNP